MDAERKDQIRASNRRRAYNCPKCGAFHEERDGAEIGGLPGIKYKYCNSCGWCQAKAKRPRKERL
jgi:Pyruvate/2-oxoacid:ferredoxin oxidoreductase delta subunit